MSAADRSRYVVGCDPRTEAMPMRRRDFITVLGGAAATWPVPARTQQSDRVRLIGLLISTTESDPEGQAQVAAPRQGLRRLGWVEGRNIQIHYRWSPDPDRRRAYAAELVALNSDVIIACATSPLAALQQLTKTIPIVFAQVSDPLGMGFVTSFAHPGGNITGFALYDQAIGVKWLELVKQIAPHIIHVAVIYDPAAPQSTGYLRAIEAGVAPFAVQLTSVAVRDVSEIERAIDALARKSSSGMIMLPGPITMANSELIIVMAAQHRLPAVYPERFFVTSGGLASYGVDYIDQYVRAASYVDRILKGEKPGDLPVQAADKFQLVINLKTAKALGLEIPLTVLARADEVIE